MLKRWRKTNRFISNKEFNLLLLKIKSILSKDRKIVFTPDNTGSNWLGVKNASISMFPENTVILPQNYSNTLLHKDQINLITKEIEEAGQIQVVFSGIPYYSYDWIRVLGNMNVEVSVVFHGGLAELTGNQERIDQMRILIDYANSGLIKKIGVIKDGLDEWFRQKVKASVHKLYPVFIPPKELKYSNKESNQINIGIFGNSSYNKNRHTQVAAASLIENSVVHIFEPNEFDYCLPSERIKTHSMLNYPEFLELMGSMDVNIYCSFSESWGQIIFESLYMNTPCLFSNNSGIDQFIGTEFLIQDYDNPSKIAEKINQCLNSKFIKPDFRSLNNIFIQENSKFIS